MQPKILVVDDDPVMLNIYARVFSGRAYVVTFSNSVAAATTLIKANHYELLVTDLALGDGLGTELTLLFSQKNPGAKSLIVSGSLGEADPHDFSAVSACLGKPLDIDRFMETIAKVLDKPLVLPADHKP
ncbi:MAG: response regulator [Elusimicrobia bacterium]|nr:response regulator [Elusimicrobiota bacterium]